MKHTSVVLAAALLALLTRTAASADQTSLPIARFSVSASLTAPPQQSADQRYSIVAKLGANTSQQTGRYSLTARLLPDPKTSRGVCATSSDLIFADGFEN